MTTTRTFSDNTRRPIIITVTIKPHGGSDLYLSLVSSQRGSWGSSYSETPESMGEPPEERRELRTSMAPECREELESTDTCEARSNRLPSIPFNSTGDRDAKLS